MIPRHAQADVESLLARFPIVALVGARQVGKTTLAKALADCWGTDSIYLDLERQGDTARLADAELFLAAHQDKLVIIDEIQVRPDLFPTLRNLVDQARRPGRFLILGSASPSMKRQASESLAGRIAYRELCPFSLSEVAESSGDDYQRLWVRGGYPESFLADSEEASVQWRGQFIQTHLERDIPMLGIRIPAAALDRFWRMLAHNHGQLWNASRIAESLGVTGPTARHYLDVLQDTFMVRRLQPLHANLKKRLVKTPKTYLRDSGLLHVLLRLPAWNDVVGHPVVGASWEGWCIEQVCSAMPAMWGACFYRTSAAAEIDLVLLPPGNRSPIAVEFKFSLSPRLTRGFWTAFADIEASRAYVVYPGRDRWPMAERVEALPIRTITDVFEGQ